MPERQSSRADEYLRAMGIEVWRERYSASAEVSPAKEDIAQVAQLTKKTVHSANQVAAPEENIPETVDMTAPPVSTLSWQELCSRVSNCHQCGLSGERTKTVFGAGNQQASLMLISGAPDDDEDKTGEPFAGESGQLLNAMLKAIGFNRNQVYITNITKCKTPDNREPSEDETELCLSYLKRQMELVQPDLILALGLTAAQTILNTPSTLNRLRGQLHYVEDIKSPVVVSYHPSYLLRAAKEKRKAWEDLKMVMYHPGLVKGQ